jgi:TfoX/Sxy family transcriptional regulator of competence genes
VTGTRKVSELQDALAQRLREVLAPHRKVREVRMFGGLSFMVDGRMAVAAGRDGDLLVRTDPADYDRLLQRGGEPAHMGEDRPMGRGWLTVRHQHLRADDELAHSVEVGIASQGGLSRHVWTTAVPGRNSPHVPRYLISFDDGSRTHVPAEDWHEVGRGRSRTVRSR